MPYYLGATCKYTCVSFRANEVYVEVDALVIRAISRYTSCSVFSMQLPCVMIIAETNKLAVEYLISL